MHGCKRKEGRLTKRRVNRHHLDGQEPETRARDLGSKQLVEGISEVSPNDSVLYSQVCAFSSHHQRSFVWQQIGSDAETRSQKQIICIHQVHALGDQVILPKKWIQSIWRHKENMA